MPHHRNEDPALPNSNLTAHESDETPDAASSGGLASRYAPAEVESVTYAWWESRGYFKAQDRSTKIPYSIMLPPPNVTGSLHIGHALDQTIQDTLIRWKRMSGFNALWMPGTDHAGIATQMVVERELKKEKLTRHSLGREKFLERVWQWKKTYGDRIVDQMKRLGNSCDWDRARFTLDPGVSSAVRRVFVQLHKEGLIYKGEKLINWDTQLESAVSDLEVDYREEKGSLWHIKYAIEGTSEFLTVATTRPETLLGDSAVAVHPDDKRFAQYIGKHVELPLTGRKIPIIGDTYVEMAFGSGVVKITPAHDFNDYEIGIRHKLAMINILQTNGILNDNGGAYKGLTVKQARAKVLEDLTEQGLLIKEEPHQLKTPISERTGVVIEPFLSQQWFVKIKPLAVPATRVVESGTVQFLPETWTKTYLHWMNNIEDWCISRQLWWGHRVPAWHCAQCDHITVSETDVAACEKCQSKEVFQENDVLDTWFSSALWPFSTLGWPEETEALKTFYPTDVLVTGPDIIFFWVARMIMQGLHFKNDVPFRTVYLHGLVRDSQGRKMSKTVGNTVDPLELVDKYGADSLRFTLLSQIAGGRDLKFSEQRLEGYRNFMNKIWNATRFALGTLGDFKPELNAKGEVIIPAKINLSLPDQWILFKLGQTEVETNKSLDQFRFSDAASTLYSFTWHDFCDWYLEFIKPIMYGADSADKRATQTVLSVVLNRIVRLLHPMIPFITEAIYQKLPIHGEACIIDQYPTADLDRDWIALGSESSCHQLDFVRDVIAAIRNIRGENRISPAVEVTARLGIKDDETQKILSENREFIVRLGKLSDLQVVPAQQLSLSKAAVTEVMLHRLSTNVVIPLEGLVDIDEEVKRIEKNLEKLTREHASLESRLGNENFVKNAPPDVVVLDREKLTQMKTQLRSMNESISRLRT